MRSGWPSSEGDSGSHPVGQRQQPFGPQDSWPGGYGGAEHSGGDYRYQADSQAQHYQSQAAYAPPAGPQAARSQAAPLTPQGHGEHPYAAFTRSAGSGYPQPAPDSFGYGDPGYSNPGYDGPSSQDAGVAGTRTVRGFVEPGHPGAAAYPGHALPPGLAPAMGDDVGYGQPDPYLPAWDYSQPLRYEGEPDLPPGHPSGAYPIQGDYAPDRYAGPDGFGPVGHDAPASYRGYPDAGRPGPSYDDLSAQRPGYNTGSYNGSELSRPGIDGLGYDLSEIIGTSDFPQYGYDEPSVERLSYDDPRYLDGYGDTPGGSRYDGPRFDETRLDNFWQDGDGGSGYQGPAGSGYKDDGLSSLGRGSGSHRGGRSDETRLDLGYRANQTRFDMPVYDPKGDETRFDMLADLAPGRAATALLAPHEPFAGERPAGWEDGTPADSFAGELAAGYGAEPSRAVATAMREIRTSPAREETGSQRAAGRRRGRSSDRRQWLALGAVVVVAAGAIAGVLTKFVFTGPSGPAHTISTPAQLDSYTRSPSLEKAVDITGLREKVIQGSSGQASDVLSAVYAQGSASPGTVSNQQLFMFVGGHLANSAPASSISSFEHTYPGASVVDAGALGGQAACTKTTSGGESLSMCVWFDNDSFGTLVSPSMTTAKLAGTMLTVRPGVEQVTQGH
jgi:hypothetical protein